MHLPYLWRIHRQQTERVNDFSLGGRCDLCDALPLRDLRAHLPGRFSWQKVNYLSIRSPRGLVFAGRQDLLGVIREENAFLGGHPLGHGLAVGHLQGQLQKLGAQQRIALNRGIQLAGDHRLKCPACSVDRYDLDIHARPETVRFDRLDGAERHVVVVRVDRGDVLAVSFQKGFHHFLALGDR